MMDYQSIAAANIRAAGLTGRSRKYGTRAHAAVFGVIEKEQLGFFRLSLEEVVEAALQPLKSTGWGWISDWINAAIRQALTLIVPQVLTWLEQQIRDWLKRNRVGAVMHGWNLDLARAGVFGELQSLFEEARKVLHPGKRWARWFAPLAIIVALCGCPEREPYDPNDPTPPSAAGAWVLVVRESSAVPPTQAQMLEALLRSVPQAGHRLRVYDPDQTADLDRLNLRPHITKAGVPALIVLDAQGKVLLASKLPEGEAAALAAIRRATGQ